MKASGEHGRVMKNDVFAYVKTRFNYATGASHPKRLQSLLVYLHYQILAAFGGGEIKAMTRLQQVSVPIVIKITLFPSDAV